MLWSTALGQRCQGEIKAGADCEPHGQCEGVSMNMPLDVVESAYDAFYCCCCQLEISIIGDFQCLP